MIYIGLGSNQDAEKYIRYALHQLCKRYHPLLLSPLYRSPAWGFTGPDFLNMVVRLSPFPPLSELHQELKEIERQCGRKAGLPAFSNRCIDLDILLYGQQQIDQGTIRIPRPEIATAAFALQPLAQIAPDEQHPKNAQSYHSMWQKLATQQAPLENIPFDWIA